MFTCALLLLNRLNGSFISKNPPKSCPKGPHLGAMGSKRTKYLGPLGPIGPKWGPLGGPKSFENTVNTDVSLLRSHLALKMAAQAPLWSHLALKTAAQALLRSHLTLKLAARAPLWSHLALKITAQTPLWCPLAIKNAVQAPLQNLLALLRAPWRSKLACKEAVRKSCLCCH